jgi:hypothetical protein
VFKRRTHHKRHGQIPANSAGAVRPALALAAAAIGVGVVLALWSVSQENESAIADSSEETIPTLEGPAPAERKLSSGHKRMLDALQKIAEETPNNNPFLGDKEARAARALHERILDEATSSQLFISHSNLAGAELRLGNETLAIEHARAAYDLIPKLEGQLSEDRLTLAVFQLALSYLRIGETQNCCKLTTPESCLLPIKGGGIHTDKKGSTLAIKYLREVLERSQGEHLRARWLLNIAYMTLGTYPDEVPAEHLIDPGVFDSEEPFPAFKNIAAELGVDSVNLVGGTIADDFDNDGYIDIVTSCWDATAPMHYFKNDADGSFTDRTEEAGLGGLMGGINMVQADYNNDGYTDIFIQRGAWLGEAGKHPNSLLRNNGDGSFSDVTFESGLGEAHPTQCASWADFDNDGHIDLFVANEGMACQLFRNNGKGTFFDVARAAGVLNERFAKGVVWGDYDEDRYPDIYVSNMQGINRLYHNNQDGTFSDVAIELGVAGPTLSFPLWFWDYNNDGVLDIYVPSYDGQPPALHQVVMSYLGQEYTMEGPSLYEGDGQGGFVDVAKERNLNKLALPMGSNFGDLDNDGYLDIYLGTGYPSFEALMPNVMFHNVAGKRFYDVTTAGGFGHLQKGHAVAFADFDHDGDQDIFEEMGGAFPGDKFADSFYENPGFDNHWITVKLVGRESNRSAIGARIKIDITEASGQRSVYRHVNSGGSFGANPLRQTIGLGKATKIDKLSIYWPTTDKTQVFEDVAMDRIIQIDEAQNEVQHLQLKSFRFDAGE